VVLPGRKEVSLATYSDLFLFQWGYSNFQAQDYAASGLIAACFCFCILRCRWGLAEGLRSGKVSTHGRPTAPFCGGGLRIRTDQRADAQSAELGSSRELGADVPGRTCNKYGCQICCLISQRPRKSS